MLNLILRILQRNKGNLFQPIICSEESYKQIVKAIDSKYNIFLHTDLYHFLSNENKYKQYDVLLFKIDRPLSITELRICNWFRDAFAGFGKPVLWFLSEHQFHQLVYFPDLWSCASTPLREDDELED